MTTSLTTLLINRTDEHCAKALVILKAVSHESADAIETTIMRLSCLLQAAKNARQLLVSCESQATGHRVMRIRERTQDKLEFLHKDPWLDQEMNSARRPVLVLYQQLLRECHKFSLYNYREYFLRRTRDEFRQNRNVKDPSKVDALLQRGRENLEVIRRQVIIGNLYMPEQRSIIDQQQSTHATSG